MTARTLLFAFCAFALCEGRVLPEESGGTSAVVGEDASQADGADLLTSGCDDYLSGKIDGKALSQLIDGGISEASGPEEKAALLVQVLAGLTAGGSDNSHEINELVFLYSSQLLAVSDRPDEVVQALRRVALAKKTEGGRTEGVDRIEDLRSALRFQRLSPRISSSQE